MATLAVVAFAVLIVAVILTAPDDTPSAPSISPEARLPARTYTRTFHKRPWRCDTHYYTIHDLANDYSLGGQDVTTCYSQHTYYSPRFKKRLPMDSGCYLTHTGQDVTIAVRLDTDDQSAC